MYTATNKFKESRMRDREWESLQSAGRLERAITAVLVIGGTPVFAATLLWGLVWPLFEPLSMALGGGR